MSAPFHADLAEAPLGAKVIWRTAEDGVRLRMGFWHLPKAHATILLFPGRTEYIEKYGRIISILVKQGYAVAVIDWRGQGYSDRLADDPALGHVESFSDYQIDVSALVDAVQEMALPEPWHLLAHSLGGNIGLRAILNGLKIDRAVFSAPMWGIQIPAGKRVTASVLPTLARISGKRLDYVPGTSESSYLFENGFEDNLLTTDSEHFDYLSRLGRAAPELALGGPSIQWFGEALAECNALVRNGRQRTRALGFFGSLEGIVDPKAIVKVFETWPNSKLCEIEGARHELMMEAEPARQEFIDKTLSFLGES